MGLDLEGGEKRQNYDTLIIKIINAASKSRVLRMVYKDEKMGVKILTPVKKLTHKSWPPNTSQSQAMSDRANPA
jgi:hypothetical protein